MLTNRPHCQQGYKCILTFVDQTPNVPAWTQNVSQYVSTKNTPMPENASEHVFTKLPQTCNNTKHISTCVDQTYPRPTKTQNVSQLELIKSLPCHREHKMYLKCLLTKVLLWQRGQNVCWRIHSHANMCWPKPPMTARPESASLHVLTIPFPCQQKKKCISTCVDQSPPMPARK